MTKYNKYAQKRTMPSRPRKIHPIWRGIGCILIIISPIIAYSMAHLLINMNADAGWFYIPRELSQTEKIPAMGIPVPYLYAKLMLTFVILVLGNGLLMILYAIIYQFIGPSRYGPLDAKPVRTSPKRKKPR